jgi:Ca2+-binding RTX toxin-like protein
MLKHAASACVDSLETRSLLATLVVINTAASGAGSLVAAVATAESGDVIDLTGVAGTITLSDTLVLNKSLTLTGPGRSVLAISGSDQRRVIDHVSGTIAVSGLTLRDGTGDYGGAWRSISGTANFAEVDFTSCSATRGGAISASSDSTHNLSDCRVFNNAATAFGGGIYTAGTTNLFRSTISGNAVTAESAYIGGGGMFAADAARVTVDRSAFHDNTATVTGDGMIRAAGSAIYTSSAHRFDLTRTTISRNTASATCDLGGILSGGFAIGAILVEPASHGIVQFNVDHCTVANNTAVGNGMRMSGIVASDAQGSIRNSIVAQNTNGIYENWFTQYSGGFLSNGRNNIFGGIESDYAFQSTSTDLMNGADAGVREIADNGGPNFTAALDADSPAIDASSNATEMYRDQRGYRSVGVRDIGAFEYGAIAEAAPVWSTSPLPEAFPSVPYSATITVVDPNGDPMTLSPLSTSAPFLVVATSDSGSVTLSGTPSISDFGTHTFTVRASDGTSYTDKTYTLQVGSMNAITLNGVLYINGTGQPDVINIRPRDESTIRLVRNDRIRNVSMAGITEIRVNTFAGADTITAGFFELPIIINAGEDNDTVTGGNGADRIVGGEGHDVINGGRGEDRIYGGVGDDTLIGGQGRDRIWAGDGNDQLVGGASVDRLWGEFGDDTLRGGLAADFLYGGPGNDAREVVEAEPDVVEDIESTIL